MKDSLIQNTGNGGSLTTGGPKGLQALMAKRDERNLAIAEKAKKGFQGSFMFDVTGSMYDYFDACRTNIPKIVRGIRNEIPDSEFSIGHFRNHGDESYFSEIFSLSPFIKDQEILSSRLSCIEPGGGGDGKCCLEECLQKANTLPWKENGAKAVVMIVDVHPKGVRGHSGLCPNGISPQTEMERLMAKKVKLYTIFAGEASDGAWGFYQEVSERSGGRILPISDMKMITEILVAIAMKETGNFETYIRNQESVGKITNQQKQTLLLLK